MIGLLFVDDEEGVRRSVVRALKKEPYRILTAPDGKQAIVAAKRHLSHIGVVVSDYKMPGLNGLETLRIIAAINPEITRILLTGYATMNAAIRATNEGLDGFLTKPFDNIVLRTRIREILIRKRLKQFIPPQVYEQIRNDPAVMMPARKRVTVLFCDIRGFTAMSKSTSPEKIAALLNEDYFAPFGEIAYRHNGTVDKHMGDCIMIVYGAPVPHDNDPENAVRSAIEMQKTARAANEKLAGRNGLRLHIGIGICTGEVVTGVFGSLRKREFTALGMPVNIAARLEKIAGPGEILVSENTYLEARGFPAERLVPDVRVKGIKGPLRVYRIAT
ncbi:MAG: response regulator [Deltaproteobacteria bacterium]|nr:response regulator [Deltaproteobacteria bacterium]